MHTLRIATRNSPLALWQAEFVQRELRCTHSSLKVEIIGMTTAGDRLLEQRLATVGGKGLFLKELQVSLLNGEADIAVHSMKDVPVQIPEGLTISVVCQRADPSDALVSNEYNSLEDLPGGARIGTSSLRRSAQIKHTFPDLEILPLRGNVNTRLAKLDNGEYDAIILATAGLQRLGFDNRIKERVLPERCLPAVGQGIVGIECRVDDDQVKSLISSLHSIESEIVLTAERAMNAALEGGCHVPVAGFAELKGDQIMLRGRVGAVDGSQILHSEASADEQSVQAAQALGLEVGQALLEQGAASLLATTR